MRANLNRFVLLTNLADRVVIAALSNIVHNSNSIMGNGQQVRSVREFPAVRHPNRNLLIKLLPGAAKYQVEQQAKHIQRRSDLKNQNP